MSKAERESKKYKIIWTFKQKLLILATQITSSSYFIERNETKRKNHSQHWAAPVTEKYSMFYSSLPSQSSCVMSILKNDQRLI